MWMSNVVPTFPLSMYHPQVNFRPTFIVGFLVVDVSLSSIADLQLESAIVDSRIKELEIVTASPIDGDDDDDDINTNVVIDPTLPTAPHPLIEETWGRSSTCSHDQLLQFLLH